MFTSIHKDGKATIWSATLRAKPFANVNLLSDFSDEDKKDVKIANALLLPTITKGEKKSIKWLDWVTQDIRVDFKEVNFDCPFILTVKSHPNLVSKANNWVN